MINNYPVINNYIMTKRLFRQECFYFFVSKVVFNALYAHNLNNSKFDSSPRFLQALWAITFARGNLCCSGISWLCLRCIKKTGWQEVHSTGSSVSRRAKEVNVDTHFALLNVSCP